MKWSFILLTLICFFSFCNHAKTFQKMAVFPEPIFPLPDSLFALRDIKSSLIFREFQWDSSNIPYFIDSSRRINFVKFDSLQKRELVVPLAMADSTWEMLDWEVYFVSKQEPIGNFMPIVIYIGGTDFSALVLLLLDKAHKPVSFFVLSGGNCGEDPAFCDTRHSFINKDTINTYLRRVVQQDTLSLSLPMEIDSINYQSIILPSGKIQTRQKDSVRFRRLIRESERY